MEPTTATVLVTVTGELRNNSNEISTVVYTSLTISIALAIVLLLYIIITMAISCRIKYKKKEPDLLAFHARLEPIYEEACKRLELTSLR